MLGTAAAFMSCEKTSETPIVEDNEIVFSSEINDLTRVTGNSFDAGDEISVFANDASNTYAQNIKYTYGGSLFTSQTPITYQEDQTLEFIAVYPYDEGNSVSEFTFEAYTDQTIAENFSLSDLLTAETEPTNSLSPELSFFHRMALVEVNIISSDVPADDASVVVSALSSAQCNISTNEYEGIGSVQNIEAANAASNTFQVIIAPQTIERGADFITIVIGGESYELTLNDQTVINSGVRYICEVSLSEGVVTFEGAINDWNNGGLIDTGDDDNDMLTLDAEILSYTDTEITVAVDKGDYYGNYYVGICKATEYPGSPKALAEYLVDYETTYNELDFSSVDNRVLFNQSGAIDLSVAWVIYPGMEYYIVVFGVDKNGGIITNVTEMVCTTVSTGTDIGEGDIEIVLEEITQSSIIITTTPSEEIYMYTYGIVPEDYFQESLGGDLIVTAGAIISLYSVVNFDAPDGDYILSGTKTFDLDTHWEVEADTEYRVLVFGVDSNRKITSNVCSLICTTLPYEAVTSEDGHIELTVTNVWWDDIVMSGKVVGGTVEKYYVSGCPTSYYNAVYGGDPYTMALHFMSVETGFGTDFKYTDDYIVYSGAYDQSYIALWSTLDALYSDTEYTIFAFGVNDIGGITTEITTITQRTDVGEEPFAVASDWAGTWQLTSTSSLKDGGPLSIDLVIQEGSFGFDLGIYGWSLSEERWTYPMTTLLDADGLLNIQNKTYVKDVDGGTLYYSSLAYVGGDYAGYYFLSSTSDRDDFTTFDVEFNDEKTEAILTGYTGKLSDYTTPFEYVGIELTLEDAEGNMSTYSTDPSLGFATGEMLIGPYTLTKVSNSTVLPSSASSSVVVPFAVGSAQQPLEVAAVNDGESSQNVSTRDDRVRMTRDMISQSAKSAKSATQSKLTLVK